MEMRTKHIAICTENYDRMAEFHKTIFVIKKITNGITDATGNYNPERGHISDGLNRLCAAATTTGHQRGA